MVVRARSIAERIRAVAEDEAIPTSAINVGPGAGSEALQGLSVFAGLLISLGASSSVANVIAGYITTFGRVLRVGDLI
ncbi:MAG: mechanosensitive ion channel [Gammaproteobacteria bacterium]|nr:mechanosensitive ion channel [Gammaproteobacteria bacterium]